MTRIQLENAARRVVVGLLLVGLVGWGLHLVTYRLAEASGLDLARAFQGLGGFLGLGGPGLRVIVYGALQYAVFRHAPARLAPLGRWVQRARRSREAPRTKRVPFGPRSLLARRRLRIAAQALGSLVAILLVLQPSRAPLSRPSLGLRAANLLDGTASAALVEGAVAAARWFTAEPVGPDAPPVTADAFTATLDDPVVPLMDRWDADLLAAAEGDRALAARLKAIMWVESGGRQYALSPTGCAGLMQFCSGTAQDRRYRSIFGLGRVSTCRCAPCEVPPPVQVVLETEPDAVERFADDVPCPLTDARFDATRSLRAAAAYVRDLEPDVGGSLLLIYIGYNAGPRVARRLHARLGEPDEVTIDDLRPHLADALRPWFGRRADARARGLLDVHLPKLQRAWERWRP